MPKVWVRGLGLRVEVANMANHLGNHMETGVMYGLHRVSRNRS